MRSVIFVGAVVISAWGAAPVVTLQAAQVTPPVIQEQANPPGPGMPSVTPPNPPTAHAPVPPAMPADPSYKAGPYKGALTPPPPEAMGKTYPVCTSRLQDSCVNPGQAGVDTSRRGKHHRIGHSRRG